MNNMYKTALRLLIACVGVSIFLVACDETPPKDTSKDITPPVQIAVPKFQSDSAYAFIQKQVDFGCHGGLRRNKLQLVGRCPWLPHLVGAAGLRGAAPNAGAATRRHI